MPAPPRLRDDGTLRDLVILLELRAIAAHQDRNEAVAAAYYSYFASMLPSEKSYNP
jgi:hypothetical protein